MLLVWSVLGNTGIVFRVAIQIHFVYHLRLQSTQVLSTIICTKNTIRSNHSKMDNENDDDELKIEDVMQKQVICRICFNDTAECFTSIYTQNEDGEQITSLLSELSGEIVFVDENIPSLICSVCVKDLATALRLRRLFLKSEIFLRHHLLDNLEKQEAEMAIVNDSERLDEILEDIISVREDEIKERESSIPENTAEFMSVQASEETKNDSDTLMDQSAEDPDAEQVYFETEYLLTEEIPVTVDEEQNLTTICLKDIGVIDLKKTTFKFVVDVDEAARGSGSRSPKTIKKKFDDLEGDAENLKSASPDATLEVSLEVLKLACCMCKHIAPTDEALLEHIQIHRIRDTRAAYNDLWGDVARDNKGKSERSKCELCLKTFVSEKALLRHRKMRYYEKKFQCEQCGASFGINELLRKHMAKEHLTDGKTQGEKVQCKICSKMIAKANIKFHEQNHLDKDKYTCKICDKKFSSIKYMKQHALTHSTLTFCACQLCGKPFKFKENLTAHMRVHKNDRKYKCEYCEKTYIHFTDWSRHTKTHTGERPHVCTLCGQGFIKKYALTIHTRKMHTNEKPYPCDVSDCSEAFVQGFDLKNHKAKCH